MLTAHAANMIVGAKCDNDNNLCESEYQLALF